MPGLAGRHGARVAPGIWSKRLLILAGKGGVGRSTVATALGLAAVRRGLRTLLVETDGRGDVPLALGGRAAERLAEVELQPGLHHVTISRRPALEEYLHQELPTQLPAALLARSRAFELFIEATPGMSDLLTIGKVWELVQRPRRKPHAPPYDVVILDAPASGQLVGLLAAPETFGAIARVGPVARQADRVAAMVRDPATVGVLAVATPEQMAVSETLELRRALVDRVGLGLDTVIVNRMFASRFRLAERRALAAAPEDPAVLDARWFEGRARAQRAQVARLRSALPEVPRVTLPFLFAPELHRPEIEHLADLLAGAPA